MQGPGFVQLYAVELAPTTGNPNPKPTGQTQADWPTKSFPPALPFFFFSLVFFFLGPNLLWPIRPIKWSERWLVVFLLARRYVTVFMAVYLPSPSMAIHASNHFSTNTKLTPHSTMISFREFIYHFVVLIIPIDSVNQMPSVGMPLPISLLRSNKS